MPSTAVLLVPAYASPVLVHRAYVRQRVAAGCTVAGILEPELLRRCTAAWGIVRLGAATREERIVERALLTSGVTGAQRDISQDLGYMVPSGLYASPWRYSMPAPLNRCQAAMTHGQVPFPAVYLTPSPNAPTNRPWMSSPKTEPAPCAAERSRQRRPLLARPSPPRSIADLPAVTATPTGRGIRSRPGGPGARAAAPTSGS